MIVSWDWLQEYVTPGAAPEEVVQRLAMAGLNHEGSEPIGDDWAIDLEITSNRGDCLGHIGIAREIAVLYGIPLRVAEPQVGKSATAVSQATRVDVECADLCPRYTARVMRGVKVGPSPEWLTRRLRVLGLKPVNNVVDITNYVLFECGQPLHAFDLAKLDGRRIVVRRAREGEQIVAIDHKTYPLTRDMCVIADASRAVAVGGIMGGFDTEVTEGTTELLIESAAFQPLAIRSAARRLRLHSPSSYRFERGVDIEAVDWASRRCCELIQQIAGGEILAGVIDVHTALPDREHVRLRYAQIARLLGIEIPRDEVRRILTALGAVEVESSNEALVVQCPSWRRDLTREVDLLEEVARIYGYDRIPEDVAVPMTPSHRSDYDRVAARVRSALCAAGFDEAMTISAVPPAWSDAFSPWTEQPPLQCSVPVLKGADHLRRSLVPSLLASRATNEALGNAVIELFETAKIYLPQKGELPCEQATVALVSGGDYLSLKGVVEGLLDSLHCAGPLDAVPYSNSLLDNQRASELRLRGERLGFIGELSATARQQFSLRAPASIAELSLDVLLRNAQLVPQFEPLAAYPAMSQDLNVIVDEQLLWAELENVVVEAAGPLLESVLYRETYRDPKADGPEKKRQLFSVTLRNPAGTLTAEQATEVRQRVVAAINERVGGKLLG